MLRKSNTMPKHHRPCLYHACTTPVLRAVVTKLPDKMWSFFAQLRAQRRIIYRGVVNYSAPKR